MSFDEEESGTIDTVVAGLLGGFGLSIVGSGEVRTTGGLVNKAYFVDTNEGRVVIKEHDERYRPDEHLDFQLLWLEHLHGEGLPVPKTVRTSDGSRFTRAGGKRYSCTEVIPSESYSIKGTPSIRPEAATYLGRMHKVARTFSDNNTERPDGLRRLIDPIASQVEGTTAQWKRRIGRKRTTSLFDACLLSEIDYIERLSDSIVGTIAPVYDQLEKTVIHGDFHPGNILQKAGKVTGITDFDNATLSRSKVKDVAFGAATFAGYSGKELDLDAVVEFVQAYRSENMLSREEMKVLPEAMQASLLEGLAWHVSTYYSSPETQTAERADTIQWNLQYLHELDRRKDEIRDRVSNVCLGEVVARLRHNDYSHLEELFRNKTGEEIIRAPEDSKREFTYGPTREYSNSVAVVIPSYNGVTRLSLEAALESLKHQTFLRNPKNQLEVVIVDDASTDGTEELIGAIDVNYPLRYVKMDRNLGPSHARNVGFLSTDADVILYIDNDMVQLPEFVEEHMRVHEVLDYVVLTGERDYVSPVDPHIQPEAIRKDPRSMSKAERTGNTKDVQAYDTKVEWRKLWWDVTDHLKRFGAHVTGPLKYFVGEVTKERLVPATMVTANASLKRKHLVRVGGFMDFPGWSTEDTCLGAELYAAGLYMIPLPSAKNTHIEHSCDVPDGTYNGDHQKDLADNIARYMKILRRKPRIVREIKDDYDLTPNSVPTGVLHRENKEYLTCDLHENRSGVSMSWLFQRARELCEEGQYSRALDISKTLIQREPDNPFGHLLMAECYTNEGNSPKKALAALERSLVCPGSVDPTQISKLYQSISKEFYLAGEMKEAAQVARRGTQETRDARLEHQIDRWVQKAYDTKNDRMHERNFNSARRYARNVIDLEAGGIRHIAPEHQRSQKSLFHIAESYCAEGRPRDARFAYRQFINASTLTEPRYSKALALRRVGRTYVSEGRNRDAVREFHSSLREQPNSAQTMVQLSNAYKTLGDNSSSQFWLSKYQRLQRT